MRFELLMRGIDPLSTCPSSQPILRSLRIEEEALFRVPTFLCSGLLEASRETLY